MSRKQPKELTLRTETLRQLQATDLAEVAGGAARRTIQCNGTGWNTVNTAPTD